MSGGGAHFDIGRTRVSISWRIQRLLKKNMKKIRHGQYYLINEILINWYKKKKMTTASLFPDGPMLKEEAMLIKEKVK